MQPTIYLMHTRQLDENGGYFAQEDRWKLYQCIVEVLP